MELLIFFSPFINIQTNHLQFQFEKQSFVKREWKVWHCVYVGMRCKICAVIENLPTLCCNVRVNSKISMVARLWTSHRWNRISSREIFQIFEEVVIIIYHLYQWRFIFEIIYSNTAQAKSVSNTDNNKVYIMLIENKWSWNT